MSKKEISSGAQKAEKLARNDYTKATKDSEGSAKNGKGTQADKQRKTAKASSTGAKKNGRAGFTKTSKKKAKSDANKSQKKLELTKIRAERRQARLEKKLEHKKQRLEKIAAAKAARAERLEKKRERRDLLKHETKEARIERRRREREALIEARQAKRKAALEERKAKREHRLKVRAQKRAERNDKRHTPGFGGWLAAVISLGVVTLALGAMTTYGWFMNTGLQANMLSVHTQSVYELNSLIDNLDANLAKARVSNSRDEQIRLLTDIAIQSEMAETVLERLPVEGGMTGNMTSFVNKMSDSAQSMLQTVASGKKLSESQIASLNHMYKTNAELKQSINSLTANCTEKDLLAAMNGKNVGLMFESFGEIENNPVETPKEIHDGPFAENTEKVSAKSLENLEEISAARAEELAREYFADYGATDLRCTGETLAKQLECFNVSIMTGDGEMSAQLSKRGGKVVEFNSFKDCTNKNFSVDRCIDIAQDFLSTLGYENMKAVWTSENGTTCNLNFAYEQDGVIVYSDMVKMKVCEERGKVTGMEALAYVLNHTDRQIAAASISEQDAANRLNENFNAEASRLCVMPVDGGEALAYEFTGNYDGGTYYIYIDAETGEELEVFTVIGTKQGRALM